MCVRDSIDMTTTGRMDLSQRGAVLMYACQPVDWIPLNPKPFPVSDAARITALEARLAQAEARIAALELAQKVKP